MTTSPKRPPHDALFKAAFGTPTHASALLRQVLPAELSAAIDWDTIAGVPGTFIDPELRSRQTDLLFCVEIAGAPALVYLLLEHQSSVDKWMPLRMGDYIMRIWRHRAKTAGRPLPLLIPVTICHTRGAWTGPRTLHELVEPRPSSIPGLAPMLPDLELQLFELNSLEDETLRDWALQAFPKLALVLLRDARDPQRMLLNFERWRALILEVYAAENGAEAVAQVLRYISEVVGQMRFDEFHATINTKLPEIEEITMTIAEELRQRGLQQGRQEGRQEGRAETLTKLITLKFGPLSPDRVAQIERATMEALDRTIERVLSATTLDELFTD